MKVDNRGEELMIQYCLLMFVLRLLSSGALCLFCNSGT